MKLICSGLAELGQACNRWDVLAIAGMAFIALGLGAIYPPLAALAVGGCLLGAGLYGARATALPPAANPETRDGPADDAV